ncbi:MAG: hypothetical protein H6601_11045 [Flavobacteriales bacterium]|nr:hypothetical protein [Flavobacteriales bacterium]
MSNTLASIFCLTLLICSAGCDFFEKTEERSVAAKVKEHLLYTDELVAAVPKGLTSEDSLNFVNGFIESWATQMLLLDKAELNLPAEEKNVEAQLEEYRRSLIIYKYQRQLIGQLLDTTVTEQQIEEYYNNNKDNFELQDNIARGILVKLGKESKDVEKVKNWIRSDKEESREKLEEFCIQHAKAYHLNDEAWVPFEELLSKIPKTPYLNLNYFTTYHFADVQDSTAHYLINVKEIKYKNTVSPIEFEKQNIRNILLNQRKLELTRKLEKDILEEAVAKNEFEILKN